MTKHITYYQGHGALAYITWASPWRGHFWEKTIQRRFRQVCTPHGHTWREPADALWYKDRKIWLRWFVSTLLSRPGSIFCINKLIIGTLANRYRKNRRTKVRTCVATSDIVKWITTKDIGLLPSPRALASRGYHVVQRTSRTQYTINVCWVRAGVVVSLSIKSRNTTSLETVTKLCLVSARTPHIVHRATTGRSSQSFRVAENKWNAAPRLQWPSQQSTNKTPPHVVQCLILFASCIVWCI